MSEVDDICALLEDDEIDEYILDLLTDAENIGSARKRTWGGSQIGKAPNIDRDVILMLRQQEYISITITFQTFHYIQKHISSPFSLHDKAASSLGTFAARM